MRETVNTAVLVIDDEEMVRDNIEEILVPKKSSYEHETISMAAGILFDSPATLLSPRTRNMPNFTVDKAANGIEGLELVKKSIANDSPYAVIFLDMRMQGWDGLETAIQIRKYDTRAEIIFVTAFSDRSIDEIVEQAGQNVGYHCKPYASEEIVQLATKAVTDYNKLRNLEKLIEVISSISLNEQQLTSLLQNVLDQLATFVDTDMALMGKLHDDFTYEKIFSIGALEEKVNLDELIAKVKIIKMANEEIVQIDEMVLARMDNYTIFAMLKKQEKLKTEKLYLLKLFVQNASKAIRTAELNEKLLQKEKLSAVGRAMSMMMHDLRSPIKNISLLTEQMRRENIQSECLALIENCSHQASEIFDDFLDFIKETTVKKEAVDLIKIIEEAIKTLDQRIEKKAPIAINRHFPQSILIAGDESKLKRSIENLINNAADALVDFKVHNPKIDISALESNKDNQIMITISDNGPGIPSEINKTLFDPFVTRKKKTGTGLGLAITKQYITAHGGSVKVENNEGAVFTIVLPLQ